MREQGIEKERRRGLGMAGVGMARLGGKGVRRQPVEQLAAVAGDDVELRAVHVRVDEAGHDEAARVLVALPAVAGRLGLDAGDAAALDQQPMAGAEAHRRGFGVAPGRLGAEVEQVAVHGEARRHAHAARLGIASPASSRATSRTCSRSHFDEAEACVTSCQSW